MGLANKQSLSLFKCLNRRDNGYEPAKSNINTNKSDFYNTITTTVEIFMFMT